MEKDSLLVSVILGSYSDREIYDDIKAIFSEIDIPHEKRIISAHRTPEILVQYISEAEQHGIKLFIAVAGMSAALPGVIAAYTILPVIGVPVAKKSPVMGFDSLLSMLQMPPGVPVATVALNGGKNAALLAAHILALSDDRIAEALHEYRKRQGQKLLEADAAFKKLDT